MTSTSLMMNGEQQFADGNGVPYVAGLVYMKVPNSDTLKDTWQDEGHLALNTNPIVLDAAGRCVCWGSGRYRQQLYDRLGNLVWDKITISLTSEDDVDTILAALVTTLYDVPFYLQGTLADNEICFVYLATRNLTLPAGLTASKFAILTNPAATMTLTLKKNGSSVGTVAFSTSGIVTVTVASQITLAAGDQLSVVGQAVHDATGANVAGNFVMTVV